jgi:hypothetical protein
LRRLPASPLDEEEIPFFVSIDFIQDFEANGFG